MINVQQVERLLSKWADHASGYRDEARRLETVDRHRHASSIATLEASAMAIDKCILEVLALTQNWANRCDIQCVGCCWVLSQSLSSRFLCELRLVDPGRPLTTT